ncbi:MAG: CHASE3 domain-containing protein [Alphaproteobacteria bacterium]|nr:CHASE3 domain-containing protein [Alphaproteobacteria bacterium]MDE1986493.1 CHASE3 domain-containing protein [Alphaproteobacteria bacterium]MDE2163497.1 CHASE3 domain-containing protein [Alphaproteobacteria bacterium]MDE2267227.1 CHASE3 domain-containing protein [Alphaproteobacteria bacterium]MDE2499801.1 CHASE3 domain-containing protein [Alphaproteobacteria bacterium]
MTLVRRGHLRHAATPLLVGAVTLLISAVILLGVNVTTMRKNFAWVQQADDVLLQISAVESGVVGNELTVRGYALTDDPRFLAYQKSNRERVIGSMNTLATLVSHDASQTARFGSLRKIVNRHSAIFGALIALGPGHAKQVAAAIVDPANRAVMDEMRRQLSAFQTAELRLLAERQATAARQASHTYDTAVVIVVAAFLLGGLGMLVAQHERGRNA